MAVVADEVWTLMMMMKFAAYPCWVEHRDERGTLVVVAAVVVVATLVLPMLGSIGRWTNQPVLPFDWPYST
jgi:hypothetical protein